jgi:hypothetical protein
MIRLREVIYYHRVIALIFVPKISSVSTDNLPQGVTPCLFKSDVTENFASGNDTLSSYDRCVRCCRLSQDTMKVVVLRDFIQTFKFFLFLFFKILHPQKQYYYTLL